MNALPSLTSKDLFFGAAGKQCHEQGIDNLYSVCILLCANEHKNA